MSTNAPPLPSCFSKEAWSMPIRKDPRKLEEPLIRVPPVCLQAALVRIRGGITFRGRHIEPSRNNFKTREAKLLAVI